jgi:hypothetical protein
MAVEPAGLPPWRDDMKRALAILGVVAALGLSATSWWWHIDKRLAENAEIERLEASIAAKEAELDEALREHNIERAKFDLPPITREDIEAGRYP